MSVQDVIKKSVLESGVFDKFDVPGMLTALAIALLLGGVIYLVYRKFYVGVIFSRSFAITLVGMTVLTCMVTLAISTNIVISLGMVGALSIVRFRTAVKDPMDLLYLFWAITTGITAGAGMYVLAVLAAVIMIVMIYLFYHRQQSGKIYIVVIIIPEMMPEMKSYATLEKFVILSNQRRCGKKRQRWQLKYSADRIRWTLRKKSVRLKMWMM